MKSFSRLLLFGLTCLLLTATLVACGDSPTNTSVAATTTTAAATATTVAATTTTAATTAVMTTTTADTTAANSSRTTSASSSAAVDAVKAWTPITLSQTTTDNIKKSLPASVTNFTISAFIAPEEPATAATNAQAIATAQGYSCTTILTTPSLVVVGCTATSKPDVIQNFYAAADFSKAAASYDPADVAKIGAALGANKTVVEEATGTNLVAVFQAALQGSAGSTPTTSAGTGTPTQASATPALPPYTNATQLTIPAAYMSRVNPDGKVKTEAYKTSDSPANVNTYYLEQVSKNGWTNASSKIADGDGAKKIISQGGFVVAGENEKTNQLVSVQIIPGPTAQTIGFDEVGSQETLIVVQLY